MKGRRRSFPAVAAAALVQALQLPSGPGRVALSQDPATPGYEDLRKGLETFESACGNCHPLKTVLAASLKRDEWNAVIAKMVAGETTLAKEERLRLEGFLQAKSVFEEKCSVCHDKGRCLSRSKTRDDWIRTVKKMSLMTEGGIGRADAALISSYLAVVCPEK